jgi:hypothetical protein
MSYREPAFYEHRVRMSSGWVRVYRLAEPPTEALLAYRELEIKLRQTRAEYGNGSEHETETIAEMARLWDLLNDAEREMLDAEGPTC